MTAQVEMEYAPAATEPAKATTSMAFVYPNPAVGSPGSDGKVQVVDVPEVTVISVAFEEVTARPISRRGWEFCVGG